MAYGQDLAGAARRHLRAGQVLYGTATAGSQPGCRVVAGYLFGLAGELAVKQLMRLSGMKEQPDNDPFYAHFPELKTYLRNALHGRRADVLRRVAEDSRLFQYWDVKMRYAPTNDVKDAWIETWKESAEKLISTINER